MTEYNVTVNVQTVLRVIISAESEEEAHEKAIDYAYEDTWACEATYGGAEIYEIEENHDEHPGYDAYKEEQAGLI